MKTKKQILTSVISLLALAACTKNESPAPAFPGAAGTSRAITFAVASTAPSRAAVSDLSALKRDGFAVSGTIGDTLSRFVGQTASYEASTDLFRTAVPYYYPLEGSMDFWAVYPQAYALSGFPAAPSLSVPQFPGDGQADIVVAQAEDVSRESASVALDFRHVLSQLSLSARGADRLVSYVLHSVEMNAPAAGSYTLKDSVWTPARRDTTIRINLGEEGIAVSNDAATALAGVQKLSFIPGRVSLTIGWDCWQEDVLVGRYVNATPSLTLEEGSSYDVTLVLSNVLAMPVNFEVSIQDWRGSSKEVDLGEGIARRP